LQQRVLNTLLFTNLIQNHRDPEAMLRGQNAVDECCLASTCTGSFSAFSVTSTHQRLAMMAATNQQGNAIQSLAVILILMARSDGTCGGYAMVGRTRVSPHRHIRATVRTKVDASIHARMRA
jgi:hypothetical protein